MRQDSLKPGAQLRKAKSLFSSVSRAVRICNSELLIQVFLYQVDTPGGQPCMVGHYLVIYCNHNLPIIPGRA